MLQRHTSRLPDLAAMLRLCANATQTVFLSFVLSLPIFFLPELILKNSIRTYKKANGS